MPQTKVSQKEILHRCWELIHRQGYHNTSLGQLAEAAGLGKAGLLHHFGSKANLMRAVVEYAATEFQRYVLSVAQEPLTARERFEKLLRRHARLARIERQGCFFANLTLETGREGTYNATIAEVMEAWQIAVGSLLESYLSAEEARAQAYHLLVGFEGAILFYKLSHDERHLNAFIERAVADFPKT